MASEITERPLYHGKYKMVHNPNARGRAPRYKVNDTEKPKGVTTIIGQTLSKDLMKWAVDCCVGYLKDKVPVVTEKDLEVAAVEYERLRDAGGSDGSMAHELVELYLKGTKEVEGDYSDNAINAYDAFVEWHKKTKPKVLDIEAPIYSPTYGYAGTYDMLLEIDGKTYLGDLKTTNPSKKAPAGIYAEYFIQLGGYALAHEEQRVFEISQGHTKLPFIDHLMIISAKKNGKLDVMTEKDVGLTLDDCREMFKRVVNIYHFMQVTTKQLGGK